MAAMARPGDGEDVPLYIMLKPPEQKSRKNRLFYSILGFDYKLKK
jgi:hypothetical protein